MRRSRFVLLMAFVVLAMAASASPDAHGQTNRVYVAGRVTRPGAYEIPSETRVSVEDVLQLAGGIAENGDVNRIIIRRRVGEEVTEAAAKLTDSVRPGDTVVVGTRRE
jgi:protein involved in polysaccharide export with SLBB domain